MKKIKFVGTIISGVGTIVLGIYLLMKLGFKKVILPEWVIILADFAILLGSTIYTVCNLKEYKNR